jgi:hypothetical protein
LYGNLTELSSCGLRNMAEFLLAASTFESRLCTERLPPRRVTLGYNCGMGWTLGAQNDILGMISSPTSFSTSVSATSISTSTSPIEFVTLPLSVSTTDTSSTPSVAHLISLSNLSSSTIWSLLFTFTMLAPTNILHKRHSISFNHHRSSSFSDCSLSLIIISSTTNIDKSTVSRICQMDGICVGCVGRKQKRVCLKHEHWKGLVNICNSCKQSRLVSSRILHIFRPPVFMKLPLVYKALEAHPKCGT